MTSARLEGVVRQKSDVQTQPDTPYADGYVLAVRFERFEDLQRAAGVSAKSTELESIGFVASEALAAEYEEARSRLDGEGRFSFSLLPGRYAFCVGNLETSRTSRAPFPLVVYGCFERALESLPQAVEVFYGERGLFLGP